MWCGEAAQAGGSTGISLRILPKGVTIAIFGAKQLSPLWLSVLIKKKKSTRNSYLSGLVWT